MASSTPSSTRSAAPATAFALRTRLLRSSTFRLTVAYLLVFGLSVLALLAFVYGLASSYMERQTMETIAAEIQGLAEQERQGGVAALRRVIERRSRSGPDRLGVYLLVDWAGNRVAGNLPAWPDVDPLPDGTLRFTALEPAAEPGAEPEERHVAARPFVLSPRFRLLVGRDITEKWRTQQLLWSSILVGTGAMIVLGLGGGLILSRWTLGRLEHINRATSAIMAGHLDRRVRVEGGGDEFDELALNVNAMLERIQRLLVGMRDVSDNIAHDLRTPLTRLRSRIEVALLRGDLGQGEARELLEATVRDADALIATFNALLNIARAEAGARAGEWATFDLAALGRDVFELYEPLGEERGVAVSLDVPDPGPVAVRGNRQLAAQALANLVDNAIKYTPPGGAVRVAILAGPPRLAVTDTGPGIAAADRERALERFVRLDADRSTPGNGLGLSLVQAVAQLHEARLELADRPPHGLRVTVTFREPQAGPAGEEGAGGGGAPPAGSAAAGPGPLAEAA